MVDNFVFHTATGQKPLPLLFPPYLLGHNQGNLRYFDHRLGVFCFYDIVAPNQFFAIHERAV